MKTEVRKKDIAVIGISGKFHGAGNLAAFWEKLKSGQELLHHYSEPELRAYGVDEALLKNPDYVPVESIVEKAESFDYPFFGYTRDEANLMDPQIRMMHELVWLGLEDAGCNPFRYPEKIGLYLSASNNFNWIAHTQVSNPKSVNPYYLGAIANKDFISTLISYSLNLRGPSYLTSTACSSSLASIHLACRSLLLRECNIALAGGISLETGPERGYQYAEGMISAKDGHCRSFDAAATGSVKGNGGAVLVLKKMEDAVRDKDHIYALIRATAANNDGRRKVGYTAPSVQGQAECIKLAHQVADVPYQSISYIEAHGTATKMGDPIEIAALNKAFNHDTAHQCAIGSVKSNLGHLDAAAGVAGVVKTCLALQHKQLPPSLHYTEPNPQIEFGAGPFYVNAGLRDWTRNAQEPLRAGVSSFGIGGTNVHVVLEEAAVPAGNRPSRPFQLLPFSARNPTALAGLQDQLQLFLRTNETIDLADLAYTLKTGREAFEYRSFCVAEVGPGNRTPACPLPGEVFRAAKNPNVIFLFPGQGSQYHGMARELYRYEPFFRSVMDQGFRTLTALTGEKFEDVLGYTPQAGPADDRVNHTYYTQPLVFLVEYALAAYLMKLGVKPVNMIGHSLGEYTAACLAEVFTLEEGLSLLVQRARLMEGVAPGRMLAVGAPVGRVRPWLGEKIAVAAINTPDTCVVAGPAVCLDGFTAVLEQEGITFSVLKTSHAFHSAMMDGILDDFAAALGKITLSAPRLPYLSNLTGKPVTAQEATSPAYWVRHARETVLFSGGVAQLQAVENAVFLEVGPGRSLRTFCKNHYGSQSFTGIGLLRHPTEATDDQGYLARALGELWAHGADIDWEQYYEGEDRYKTSAPGYCFDQYALDFRVDPYAKLVQGGVLTAGKRPFQEWFYRRNWKKSVLSKAQPPAGPHGYLIFSEGNAFAAGLTTAWKREAATVVEVTRGIQFEQLHDGLFSLSGKQKKEYERLFDALAGRDVHCDNIVFNWPLQGHDQEAVTAAFQTLLHLCQALLSYYPESRKKLTIIAPFNHDILGHETANPLAAAVATIAQVCAQENTHLFTATIDVEGPLADAALIAHVQDEIRHNYSTPNVAYRHNKRWADFLESVPVEAESKKTGVQPQKVYLITGGLGLIGSVLAGHLVSAYGATVILTGRTALPPESAWPGCLADAHAPEAVKAGVRKMQTLKEMGRQVHYYRMDVASAQAVQHTLSGIEQAHGQIAGVLHAAGIVDPRTFRLIENIDEESVVRQFDPKINGTLNLYRYFAGRELDFVWITSSLAAVLGGLSYGAYAAANRFIDAFLESKKEELPAWKCVNLDGIAPGTEGARDLIRIFEHTCANGEDKQCIVAYKNPNAVPAASRQPEAPEEKAGLPVAFADRDYQAPESDTEKSLAGLWQSFFGYNRISTHANFFDLGGDSLKAMTLLKRIHKNYSVEISLIDFFLKPTIKALAEEIDIAGKLARAKTKNQRTNLIKI